MFFLGVSERSRLSAYVFKASVLPSAADLYNSAGIRNSSSEWECQVSRDQTFHRYYVDWVPGTGYLEKPQQNP